MAVERIDVNIAQLQIDSQRNLQNKIEESTPEDEARRIAQRKVEERKAEIKKSQVQTDIVTRDSKVQQQWSSIVNGSAGTAPADAAMAWQNAGQLQSKLTDAQKRFVQEAMISSPRDTTPGLQAVNRLAVQPTFTQAINTSPLAGTLQQGVIANPKIEQPVSDMLASRFMQSPKADASTKNDFLRFGMAQAGRGNLESVRLAGNLLGTTVGMTRTSQRAAMGMIQRQPDNTTAMSSIDSFANGPSMRSLPTFARGRATELLCKVNGDAGLVQSFDSLIDNSKFKSQSAETRGRFFTTVGTGRPSEYRAITDLTLQALQSKDFPTRASQVNGFLTKMSAQVRTGGASSVNTPSLIKSSKTSPMPTAPRLQSTEGLSDEDAAKVRSQNRAKVLQYYNQVSRHYAGTEKSLTNAKFFEDVNSLPAARDPAELDTSVLDPDTRSLVQEKQSDLGKEAAELRKLQQQRQRELRGRRMSPEKRRAAEAERRTQGTQPRYFSPNKGTQPGASRSKTASSSPQTPARSRPSNTPGTRGQGLGNISSKVAQLLGQTGNAPLSGAQVRQLAQSIAGEVTQHVMEEIMSHLGAGKETGSGAKSDAPPRKPPAKNTGVMTDGFGVPRALSSDLGGNRGVDVVRQPSDETPPPNSSYDGLANEVYSGKLILKDDAQVRSFDSLFDGDPSKPVTWKDLSKEERTVIQNLGWTQRDWDTRFTPTARWPAVMARYFQYLQPFQRESLRRLGITPSAWDGKVAALTMGKKS